MDRQMDSYASAAALLRETSPERPVRCMRPQAAKRAAEMAEAVRVPSLLPALLPAPSPAHAFLHKLFCALKPRVAAQQKSAAAAGDDDWDDDWDEEEDEVRRAPPLPLLLALCARGLRRSGSAAHKFRLRLRLALLDFFPSWPSCSCACPCPPCLSCSCSSTASSRPLTARRCVATG